MFTPPSLDLSFKSRTSSFTKEVDRLLENASDRAGHGLHPLVVLMNQVPEDLRESVALVTLAVGQSICAINYVRRLVSLRDLWGPNMTDSARTAIKQANEQGAFGLDWLFGETFNDVCKNITSAPKAPATAKPASAPSVQYKPYNKPGQFRRDTSDKRKRTRSPPRRGYNRYLQFNNDLAIQRPGPEEGAHPVNVSHKGSSSELPEPRSKKTKFFLDMASYGATHPTMEGDHIQSNDIKLDHGGGIGPSSGTTSATKTSQLHVEEGGKTSRRYTGSRPDKFRCGNKVRKAKILSWPVRQAKARQVIPSDRRSLPPKSANSGKSLQNGSPSTGDRNTRSKRLHDEGRSQERVLQRAGTRGTSTIPSLLLEEPKLDVHKNVFRGKPGTSDFYQNYETTDQVDTTERCKGDSIHRRFLVGSQLQGNLQITNITSHGKTTLPGICSKPSEEYHRAGTDDSIPRNDNSFQRNANIPTGREETKTHKNDITNDIQEVSLDKGDVISDRKIGSDSPSVCNDPAILQNHPELDDREIPTQGNNISTTPTTESGTVGTAILGNNSSQPKTAEPYRIPRVHNNDRNRCVPDRMGSNSKRKASPRELVSRGVKTTHKRPRTISDRESNCNIQRAGENKKRAPKRRQCNKSVLHRKIGRDKKPRSHKDRNQNMGVGVTSPDKSGDRAHSGREQLQGGPSLQAEPVDREYGMDAKSSKIPQDKQNMGSTKARPIRQSVKQPTPGVHNVEISFTQKECIPLQVAKQRLSVPAICTGGKGPEKDSAGQVLSNISSTELGGPKLVPQTSIHALRLPKEAEAPTGTTDRSARECSPSGSELRSDGISCLRSRLETKGLSKEVSEIVGEAWPATTIRSYQSAWKQWTDWCGTMGLQANPEVPNINNIAQFITHKFKAGTSYSQLNTYRSALSAFLPKIDGSTVGTHPIVGKVLRACYIKRPPRPKYSTTWSVDTVLKVWDKPNDQLSIFELSIKTFTLLSIATMGRGAEIRELSSDNYKIERDDQSDKIVYIELLRLKLPKQQRSGPLLPVRITALEPDEEINLCPARTCIDYINKTIGRRPEEVKTLFITSTKPYKAIAAKTATRWILYSMREGGIDTSTFKAHSICGAAASTKAGKGISCQELVAGGRWSNTSTLKKYYLRDIV